MKPERNERRLLLLALVFFCAASLGLYFFREAVRREIFIPVLYFFWLVWLFIRSINQAVLWGGLCMLILVIGLRSLFSPRRSWNSVPESITRLSGRGRVEFWTLQMSRAVENDFFRADARTSLRGLLTAVLAHNERITRAEVNQRIVSGELNLPAEIYAYFNERLSPIPPVPANIVEAILFALRQLGEQIQKRMTRPRPKEMDARMLVILKFLEEQMEISDSHESE